MGLFRKRENILDLTVHKKSGLLERSVAVARQQEDFSLKENDVVDLTKMNVQNSENEKRNDSEAGMFGFLDNLAGTNSAIAGLSANKNLNENSMGVKELKIKIEDLEFKLERLMERLIRLEEKRI